jgi:putative oxidoreductase
MTETTPDVTLLVLRLALGGMLIAHGTNKIFGPGGLEGTTRWFAGLGLAPAWLHARMAAATELGAGALMVAGLATPFASAAFVGLMVVAACTDHRGKGFFVFKGGWEYVGLVAVLAAAVAALGPGRWSADSGLGWHPHGLLWGAFSLVLGVVSASGLLTLGRARKAE